MSGSDDKPKRSSQGQLILYHGMKLSTMMGIFKLRPSLRWYRMVRIGLMLPFGLYNSTWAAIETLLYGRKIRETQIHDEPIFVLGYWRSGTTLLHNFMAMDPRFTFPTLYETVFPWHFLSTEAINTALTSWLVPKSRPMDNVEVHWAVPQEDEFALCAMCLISPYTLPLRPFDQHEWTRSFHLDELPPAERKRWTECFLHFMKKVTVKNNRPIVMKSPSHTYRVKQILELFPKAKFVYINRHPYDVFNSALHLRATLIEENTLGSSYHPGAEEGVIETYLEAFHAYERDKHLIPAGSCAEVKYEDLSQNPLVELKRIYEELNLGGFDELKRLLEPKMAEHKQYKKNKFRPDSQWQQQVYERCREVYERFDYPPPDDDSDTAAA